MNEMVLQMLFHRSLLTSAHEFFCLSLPPGRFVCCFISSFKSIKIVTARLCQNNTMGKVPRQIRGKQGGGRKEGKGVERTCIKQANGLTWPQSAAHLGETAQNEDALMAPARQHCRHTSLSMVRLRSLTPDFPSDTGPAALFPVALH